jgi:hypothetical protein
MVLPDHLQELILMDLSFTELARVFTTCHVFKNAFVRKVAELQKARCDLAVKSFGRERVATIGALMGRFVKGETVDSVLVMNATNHCHISGDGTLHLRGPATAQVHESGGDIQVSVCVHDTSQCASPCMSMKVEAPNHSMVYVSMMQDREVVSIRVNPSSEDDFEGVALVQALLSGALAQALRDAGLSCDIYVHWCLSNRWTPAGFRGQIRPILPLASHYTINNQWWWGRGVLSER